MSKKEFIKNKSLYEDLSKKKFLEPEPEKHTVRNTIIVISILVVFCAITICIGIFMKPEETIETEQTTTEATTIDLFPEEPETSSGSEETGEPTETTVLFNIGGN